MVFDLFARAPRTDDWDELVSIEPFFSEECGNGGTSSEGDNSPFLVDERGLRRPFAFGADATRRKNRAAVPMELGLLGLEFAMGPPAIPFPNCCVGLLPVLLLLSLSEFCLNDCWDG